MSSVLRGVALAVLMYTGVDHALARSSAAPSICSDVSRGLFDVCRDVTKNRALLRIAEFRTPFLLVSSLPGGLGSNDVGLDRGQSGNVREVEFRRAGPRVLLVQLNSRYIASANDAAERASAVDAFAESVLWSGEVVADPGASDKSVIVDFSTFILSDVHGMSARLEQSKQGKYAVDAERSAVLLDQARSFPDNTELEALVTLKGTGDGEFVQQVAVDPTTLSLRQHLSLVRLPGDGFQPRRYHPASGGFSSGVIDFSQPLAASLDVRMQPRFRLEKIDPTSALSPVRKPIVFYLDAGTPEPVRSALLEGANWWKGAFEDAGYKDAFRVELLPPDVDPMDIRYNVILWTHRATRGWSYGSALIDPRSGEIIKGVVNLGSQRVRQDILIAEALLAPYGKADAATLSKQAEAMALARLRQLAAHEVGHSLGFAHNFAGSRAGNGSVMDYPHPLLRLDEHDNVALDQAYGAGIGPWDRFLVKHAYAAFSAENEQSGLAALRRDAAAVGLDYVSDADARAPGSAHPDALLWDTGKNTLSTFDTILAVRHKALQGFSKGVLPPDRQLGELEARLVPIYLLHRYQTEAVARLLGGASYKYGLAADTRAGAATVPATQQYAALQRLVSTLSAEQLALPTSVVDLMTPPGNEYLRTPEFFATRSAPLFDAISAAEAAAAQTCQFLFEPSRLNRLAWQHARDAAQPGIGELLNQVFVGTWRRTLAPSANNATNVGADVVQIAANWTMLDGLLAAVDGAQLHADVDAQVRLELQRWQLWLTQNPGTAPFAASRKQAAVLIARYLDDPKSVKLRPLPTIPPGAPI
ncbi:MAG: zinc-dependent metalloprotease [Tahibacter sp.]